MKNSKKTKKLSIGIDLGTTNSAVAVRRLESEVIPNDKGELITPSCVYIKESSHALPLENVVVGENALNWKKQDHKATITHVKRLMGRDFYDENVQNIITKQLTGYQIQKGRSGSDDSLVISIPSQSQQESFEFTPEEISSVILKKLKQDVERETGCLVDKAIITVPAYFNDKQRHATLIAARLADLENCHLLSEPSAASIAFGIDDEKGQAVKTIMVFDFGGGTLDISVLTMGGQKFIEQGKTGDMWLGGKDIDQALVEYLLKKASDEHDDFDLSDILTKMPEAKALRAKLEMENLAEKAKIELSHKESTKIIASGIFQEDGIPVDFELTLNRKEFDSVISPMIDRAMELTLDLLHDLNLKPDYIDDVLLVGGSSQLNLVIKTMREKFGTNKVHVHSRPMLAVVEGAAIYSQYKTNNLSDNSQKKASLSNVLFTSAHDYFLKSPCDNESPVLLVKKNAPLPFEAIVEIQLENAKQKLLHLQFLNLVNNNHEPIGRLWLPLNLSNTMAEKIESMDGPPVLILKIKIDENNLISVSCLLKDAEDIELHHSISRGKADERLYFQLEKGIQTANQSDKIWIKLDYENRALSIIEDINQVLDSQTETIDSKAAKKAQLKIETANDLGKKGETLFPNIWYLQDLYNYCIHNPFYNTNVKQLKIFEERLKKLKEIHLEGKADELIDMKNDLFKFGKKHFSRQVNNINYIHSMEQGRRLNMNKEIDEIHNLSLSKDNSSKKEERIRTLFEEIKKKSDSEPYEINTNFTVS